jgi:hypothetical protein
MRTNLPRLSLLAGLALALFSLTTSTAEAQQPPTAGITVAPASITLELSKGTATQEGAIGIRNNSAQPVRLSAAIRGLEQATDGSLAPSTKIDPGIAKALSVDRSEFILDAGKSVNLKLRAQDNPELMPGGHYASLFIREVQASGQNLMLSQAVSVRIFMIKENGAVRALSVESVRDNGGLFSVPSAVTVTFGNPGNVGVVPRASVGVYDPRGRMVASGVLNIESVMVQPGKQAQLRAAVVGQGRAWLPGKYVQRVMYRYEGSDEQITGSASMIIIPPLFIVLSLLGLGVLVGAVWLARRFWPRRKSGAALGGSNVSVDRAPHTTSTAASTPSSRQRPRRIDIT